LRREKLISLKKTDQSSEIPREGERELLYIYIVVVLNNKIVISREKILVDQ